MRMLGVVDVAVWQTQRGRPEERMEKRLIKKVSEHPFLYTVDHVHYRDRHMRASAWQEIGKELGIQATQCKETWRKLRNCYLNAINRRQHKNIPKWKFETEMAFLLPYLDTALNRSKSDLEHVSASYSDAGSEIIAYEEPPSPQGSPESPEIILPETSGMEVPSHGGPRFGQEVEVPQEVTRRPDETELFFLSLSETVRRLRPLDQARIKMNLCNMVYEAEIQMLQRQEEEDHS